MIVKKDNKRKTNKQRSVRRVLPAPSGFRSRLTIANDNRTEFEEFMTAKGCQIFIEYIETPDFGLPIIFEDVFGKFQFPIKRMSYPNGLLKDFHIHFEKDLKFSPNFSAERDFALFVISFLDAQKISKKEALKHLIKI